MRRRPPPPVTAAVPPWGTALVEGLSARLEGSGLVDERRPASTRVVAVDGWSGSGKSALASWLAPALGAPCVPVEDFVPGWHGLAESVRLLVRWVLEPLAAGEAARWRRWDWAAGGWGEEVSLAPAPLVLVEGCGAGAAAARPWLDTLVWLEVGAGERARRLRARDDWVIYAPWAQVWSDQERALRAGDDPRRHADAVVEDRPSGTRVAWRDAP